MVKNVYKQFLPVGFLLAVIIALVWPWPGQELYHIMIGSWKVIPTINLIIIFFIFGISLDTQELKSAMKAWKSLIVGDVSILVLTSLTGFIPIYLPFNPKAFSIGLAIMACVPTSLSSGVTLVIQGEGHGTLALLQTVTTNILGIFISPIFIKLVLGGAVEGLKIDGVDLLIKLMFQILVPLLIGKAVRELFKAKVVPFVKKYKIPLSCINSFQIIMIVWQTLSNSQKKLLERSALEIVMAVVAAIVQHIAFLVMNMLLTWVLRLPEKERKAVIIMASQKALPIAAVVISTLDEAKVGSLGLISIPCIVFYVMQLFIDAVIANHWASKYEKANALQEKYKDQLAALDQETAPTRQPVGKTDSELPSEQIKDEDKVSLLNGNGTSSANLAEH